MNNLNGVCLSDWLVLVVVSKHDLFEPKIELFSLVKFVVVNTIPFG